MSYFTNSDHDMLGTTATTEDASETVENIKASTEGCKKTKNAADNKTTFHLIRSVKGGSGKTAFSLHKAIDFAVEKHSIGNRDHSNNAKVLYIDADVHATQTLDMLSNEIASRYTIGRLDMERSFRTFDFGSDFYEKFKTMKSCMYDGLSIDTLNSYMYPFKGYYSTIEDIIYKAEIKECKINVDNAYSQTNDYPISVCESAEGSVDFIFSDCTKQGISVFDSFYQMNGKSVIGVGAYIARIRNLLCYAVNKGYEDVIIDMPPGSDTFSSHLADVLINFTSTKHNKCQLFVYYVSSPDSHHLNASKTAIIEHMHTMQSSSPQKLIFVYNVGREPKYANNIHEVSVDKLYQAIDIKDTTDIFELSRLEFQVFYHDQLYYDCAIFASDKKSSPMFDVKSKDESLIVITKHIEV